MCIICIEFQRNNDLGDARQMLANARREPKSVDAQHLDEVERELDEAAAKQKASTSARP